MEPTPADVLGVITGLPTGIGELGLTVAALHGSEPTGSELPVGQRLASVGLSLSALQKVIDQLVRDGQVREVRGRELWDLGLPTQGTKATGRYYLRP